MTVTAFVRMKRCAALLVVFALLAAFFAPTASFAQPESNTQVQPTAQTPRKKTVRVGWYESSYNITGYLGRRSGYAYEYQCKIASYTNWTYEYVTGSWSELMEKLKAGEIDLMSDVSYTEERSTQMLFPSYPMGSEEYYLFIASDNTDYTRGDYSFFNGKRVGISQGSIQKGLFEEWAKENGVSAEIVEFSGLDVDLIQKVQNGELDALVTIDTYGGEDSVVPVAKVGSSDIFFAVNKDCPDLLADLNAAMSKIQDENRYYNQSLYEKYVGSSGANLFLASEELDWLNKHGPIRVGYQDNYLAYCAKDPETGELAGALRDYLDSASNCFANTHIVFEPSAYPTSSDALDALRNGEVDCVFPVNLSDYDAEVRKLDATPPVMTTEIYAVVRSDDRKSFSEKEEATVAVLDGDLNYDTFLMDNYPTWKKKPCKDAQECLGAVADGAADCFLVSSYRFNSISSMLDQYKLTTLDLGKEANYCFAVNEGESQLYSIFARASGLVPDATVNASLTRYFAEDGHVDLFTFVQHNPLIAAAFALVVVAMVAVIVAQSRMIKVKKTADERKHQVEDLSQRVFVDPLTRVRNKGAFDDNIHGLQERLDNGGPFEFAIGILDCDDLKVVNDEFGHEKGDEYLKTACHYICVVYRHSPVFRIGGDEFAVILEGEDFQNREELADNFQAGMLKACESSENMWEQVHLSSGIAVFDPEVDTTVEDTMRRADKIMYENKRMRKGARAR